MTDHLHSPASTETGLQRKITAFTGLQLDYLPRPGETGFTSRREPTAKQMDYLHHLEHRGALQIGESNVRQEGDNRPAVMLTRIDPVKLSACIAEVAQTLPMLQAIRPGLERYTDTLWTMSQTGIWTPASDQSVVHQIALLESRGMLETRPYPGRIVVIKVSLRLIRELDQIKTLDTDTYGHHHNGAASEPEPRVPIINLDEVIASWRRNNNGPQGISPGMP